MTTQPLLPFAPTGGGTLIGPAVALVENEDGGQVFIHGLLTHVWTVGDEESRRYAAVNLLSLRAAAAPVIATGFGVSTATLWRWKSAADVQGITGLVSEKRGPQGNSKLDHALITRIHQLKAAGLSNRAAASEARVSEFSVRRAMTLNPETGQATNSSSTNQTRTEHTVLARTPAVPEQLALPILAEPEPRIQERLAASTGDLFEAYPVFTASARIPYAGLLLALPALEATALVQCVDQTYGSLKPGFYGLNTMILETVLRTLAGEPRAEGATRLDPLGFGRILGMDRAPEVKTVRRKHQELAATGKAADLLTALGRHHMASTLPTAQDKLGLLLYVDGHVRSYQGKKKTGKQYSTRLKFPVPATMESWVADANGSPVFMVMAKPSSSLVGELRRLTPALREMIGDDRRVLIGFDREGWSPQLFHDLAKAGFDPLTWRKGTTEEVGTDLFTACEYVDQFGTTHEYGQVADTTVTLAYGPKGQETRFRMRQISRIVAAGKQVREATGAKERQIHILTTNTDLPAAEVVFRMSARWRHENYFRYARQHFALDAHDSYQAFTDDSERRVPNPLKEKAKQKRDALAAKVRALAAAADFQELLMASPEPGTAVTITNKMLNELNAPVLAAEKQLVQASKEYQAIAAKLPLGEVNPGQQVLESELKQVLHAFRMAAYNVMMMLATQVRTQTGLKAASKEAHVFVRQALKLTGDLDPREDGVLEVALDPLPTRRATEALGELCGLLTGTCSVYPGTDRVLRYRVKGLPVS
ncbi:putative transposase [Glutamicibacter ardleyensis]|uniref:putative transposase n=2 Tax=Glutamicibacter ardleyensis TaxID=225894 RepID=UPI003FD525A0